MYPASFEYLAPASLDEAIGLLKQHGEDAKLLAGGHSLLPTMKLRLARPRYLVDLAGVAGLAGIQEDNGRVVIGAMTLHTDLAASALVKEKLTALSEAAAVVGDPQVRNRGTLGGSVAHADPNADEPVALLALNASFTLVGPSGRRQVPANDFFVDVFTTALQPDEVLTEIVLPLSPAGAASAYRKLPHPASGFVVVSCAAFLAGDKNSCQEARVALGGVSGRPVRAGGVESALQGQAPTAEAIAAAASHAAEGTDPTDDLYASAEYKRHMAEVYARDVLQLAAGRLA